MSTLPAPTAWRRGAVCFALLSLTACDSSTGPGPTGIGPQGMVDAQVSLDAAATTDAAQPGDAQVLAESGTGLDASQATDARATLDSGSTLDAAGPSADGGGDGSRSNDGGLPDASAGDGSAADASPDGSTDAQAEAGGPKGDWTAGDYPSDLTGDAYLEIADLPGQNGHTRGYKVHVPPGYDPATPTPLVFCIHGLGQNAVLFCVNGAGWPDKSDEEGFILVMPNGYSNSWNAGTCCGNASSEALDEVAFFRAIFDEVTQHLNVDLDRVYATGLSNGAFMTYRLVCEAADLFAAVAPAAGAIGINDIGGGTNPFSDFDTCEPSRPVPVLDSHGTADALVPYALQAPTLELLQQSYGCDATTVAATQPMSGGDTTCTTYTGCPTDVELTQCTVDGGGHCWFGSPDCGTGAGDIGLAAVGSNSDTLEFTDAAWAFMSRFTR